MRADSHVGMSKGAEKSREDFRKEMESIKGMWVLVKKGLTGKF